MNNVDIKPLYNEATNHVGLYHSKNTLGPLGITVRAEYIAM